MEQYNRVNVNSLKEFFEYFQTPESQKNIYSAFSEENSSSNSSQELQKSNIEKIRKNSFSDYCNYNSPNEKQFYENVSSIVDKSESEEPDNDELNKICTELGLNYILLQQIIEQFQQMDLRYFLNINFNQDYMQLCYSIQEYKKQTKQILESIKTGNGIAHCILIAAALWELDDYLGSHFAYSWITDQKDSCLREAPILDIMNNLWEKMKQEKTPQQSENLIINRNGKIIIPRLNAPLHLSHEFITTLSQMMDEFYDYLAWKDKHPDLYPQETLTKRLNTFIEEWHTGQFEQSEEDAKKEVQLIATELYQQFLGYLEETKQLIGENFNINDHSGVCFDYFHVDLARRYDLPDFISDEMSSLSTYQRRLKEALRINN